MVGSPPEGLVPLDSSINWTIDQAEFDDLLALKKDSALGPDGIPCGVDRCAWWPWFEVSLSCFDCVAESRTVFITKTSDTDDLGRIVRSPDALRPLTLCNFDCKILTSAICRGPHW